MTPCGPWPGRRGSPPPPPPSGNPGSPTLVTRLGLTIPEAADYTDVHVLTDANTVPYSSLGTLYGGAALRVVVPDGVIKSGGIYRSIAADIPDVGNTAAYLALIGWRRTNQNAKTASGDFFAWFAVGGRQVGVCRFAGAGARYQGTAEDTCQLVAVASSSNLSAPFAAGGSLSRQGTLAAIALSVERTGATTVQVDSWLAPGGDEFYYLESREVITATDPILMYGLHPNANGHDGELLVYGEAALSVAELSSSVGLTKP